MRHHHSQEQVQPRKKVSEGEIRFSIPDSLLIV